MLMTLSWVMSLTDPLFYIGDRGFSFKDFLLILGGLFLIIKSGWEILNDVYFGLHASKKEKQFNAAKNMVAAILQIALIDFIFSFDSVITAVGMTNNIPVIITAITIAMGVMLLASERISYVILLSDGFHFEISKGYLYFSLFFTVVVESLNIVARKLRKQND